jgi:hypothetical protein
MKVMLTLYGSDVSTEDQEPGEMAAELTAHGAFSAMVAERGATFYDEARRGPDTACAIRTSDTEDFMLSDGRVTEVKELSAGSTSRPST